MGKDSKIPWCDHTFNPWWGCYKIGDDCKYCYAESNSARWGHDVWGIDKDRRFFGDKHWNQPLKWDRDAERAGKPALVFCGSMCDIFEYRTDLLVERLKLFELIHRTPNLIWLLLTKRTNNLGDLTHPLKVLSSSASEFPSNVWFGMSAGDQATFNKRIFDFNEFLIANTIIENINLSLPSWKGKSYEQAKLVRQVKTFLSAEPLIGMLSLGINTVSFDWVIAGGESRGRACNPYWVRLLRNECFLSQTPFMFKQWGKWKPTPSCDDKTGFIYEPVGKAKAGWLLDGVEYAEFPEEFDR